jgi:uncharacterized protein YaaW (UPF0174 family)
MRDRLLWPVLDEAKEGDLAPLSSLLRDADLRPEQRLMQKKPKDIQQALHDLILWAGGHSIHNRLRGYGPSYAQVVRQAALRLKIPYSPLESTIEVEERVATTVLNAMPECVNQEQFEELGGNLARLHWPGHVPFWRGALTVALLAGRFLGKGAQRLTTLAAEGGSLVLSAFGLGILAHAILGGVATILLGHIAWIAMAVWTLCDLQGPSFRISIPSIVMVSTLRARSQGTARPIGFRE